MKMMFMNRRFRGLENKLQIRIKHTNMFWYMHWKDTYLTRAKKIILDALTRSYSLLRYIELKEKLDEQITYI